MITTKNKASIRGVNKETPKEASRIVEEGVPPPSIGGNTLKWLEGGLK